MFYKGGEKNEYPIHIHETWGQYCKKMCGSFALRANINLLLVLFKALNCLDNLNLCLIVLHFIRVALKEC